MFKTLIDWKAVERELKQEKEKINKTIKEIEAYVENLQSKKPGVNMGLVYTKIEEDIEKGRFMIWIEKGIYIDHKYISLDVIKTA